MKSYSYENGIKWFVRNRMMTFYSLIFIFVLPFANADELQNNSFDAPRKVAVITSTGVNGDCQSVNDYDSTLEKLGWKFDKFMNTEMKKVFADNQKSYDLVLGTSLWNYGNPQDLAPLVPDIRAYLESGGVMILTDMNYDSMTLWTKILDPELAIEYQLLRNLGLQSAIDFNQTSPILKFPYEITSGLNGWAYFSKWGSNFTPIIQLRKAGTAVMLSARVGRGILIVTTCGHLDEEILQNAYSMACGMKKGIEICPVFGKTPDWPGKWDIHVNIRSKKQPAEKYMLSAIVSYGNDKKKLPPQEITIKPNSIASFQYPLMISARGTQKIELFLNDQLIAVRTVVIPPILILDCNRPILAMNDNLIVTARVLLPEAELKNTKLHISLIQRNRNLSLFDGLAESDKKVQIPVSKIGTGKWQILAEANDNKEKTEQKTEIEIRPVATPSTQVNIGKRGELLVNGQMLFPLGTYHVSTELAKKMGFNVVSGIMFSCEQEAVGPDQIQYMKSADSLGLKVLQEYSDYVRAREFKANHLKRVVAEMRLNPATIVSYSIDEPSQQGLSPEHVKKVYDLLKECDPEHPVFICETPEAVTRYAEYGDIVGVDPYPITTGVCENFSTSIVVPLEAAIKVAKGKPVWAVIQSHRLPPATSSNRYPTPEEVRCMAYLALNHGAKGLLFYACDDTYSLDGKSWPSGFRYDNALMQSFPALLTELAKIGPAYVTGTITRIPAPQDAADLDIVKIENHDEKFRIIVNPTNRILKFADVNIKPFEVKIAEQE
jgi:hypothetical protein